MSNRILVIGGGFAGLWSAASAARARALFDVPEDGLEVVLVAADPFHTVRVRCYEADLDPIRVPLDTILKPIGVKRIEARVTGIDPMAQSVAMSPATGGPTSLPYDRLILAAGSSLVRPPIGVEGPTFDVDTYDGARRLEAHLGALADAPRDAGTTTAVVIGGGLVGIEIACELPGRLRTRLGADAAVKVVLVDQGEIGAGMGAGRSVIHDAFAALGVVALPHTAIARVGPRGVFLADGRHIPAATVIFATGMKASPLTRDLGVACDPLGRVRVDEFLNAVGVNHVFAAGDCASAEADTLGHRTVMSCQHARPTGRLAGHNAACELAGRPDDRIGFAAPDYVTVLDLGPFGAIYTSGWERGSVVARGADAKATKQTINANRIYPPSDATREAIFAAAAPILQARPGVR